MKRIALDSNQGLALLEFFPYAILFFQALISADIFYLHDDKVLTLKCSLFLSSTNNKIWSKERSMGPYEAKMLFLQVDGGFWLYCCLMQKYLN